MRFERQGPRNTRLAVLGLLLAACGAQPAASPPRDAERSILVEPRRIDLPVGADPDFDQTDPLGQLKQIRLPDLDELLRQIASKSVDPAKDLASPDATDSATTSATLDDDL